jgi:hypothetical protein
MVKGILGSIMQLNIEWCKILDYPTTDKTGGWVSEIFLAMSRLGIWFYSIIVHQPFQEKYIDPITSIKSWTKQQCERWLHVRGLCKTGKIAELKERITEYMDSGDIPIIQKIKEVNHSDIMNLVYATCKMIQKLMCNHTTVEDIDHLEALIRMFLIRYDAICKIVDEGTIPSWIKQYNMLCLLNLPDTLRKYGSIRNLWEGGNDGESYLKKVKNQLKAGLVNGWQTWVVTNLFKEKIYDEWKRNVVEESNIRKEIRIYGNYTIAGNAFQDGKPISAMAFNNKIYICYRSNGKIKGTRIKLSDKVELDYGMVYYTITLIKKSIFFKLYNIDYVGVLLLPMLTKDGYPTQNDDVKYCYIRSDWS